MLEREGMYLRILSNITIGLDKSGRQFACNDKACFLGQIRKNIPKCHLNFLPRVLSVDLAPGCSMFKVFGIGWLWFNLQVCSTQSRGYGIIPMSLLGGPESELYRWCLKMLFLKNKSLP